MQRSTKASPTKARPPTRRATGQTIEEVCSTPPEPSKMFLALPRFYKPGCIQTHSTGRANTNIRSILTILLQKELMIEVVSEKRVMCGYPFTTKRENYEAKQKPQLGRASFSLTHVLSEKNLKIDIWFLFDRGIFENDKQPRSQRAQQHARCKPHLHPTLHLNPNRASETTPSPVPFLSTGVLRPVAG